MNYQRLKMTGSNGETIKGRTPVNGANPYVDEYTGFTWNNVHSSSYNCFIENTGHLEFVGAPDFSNNFVSPAFQTRTYYTGMQNSSKKFTLNLVFYQLTLKELNAALGWLDRTIVSDLFFDYEPYWKYSCKLASIGTIEKYVTGRTMYRGKPSDLYLCRVAVQFETVYHPEAISTYCAYKYSDENGDQSAFHQYSQEGAGAEYTPFTEYNAGSKSWKPLILTREEYNEDTLTQSYWRYALKNPSAYPTYFKLHFYDVGPNVTVYQYWNNDYFNNGNSGSLGVDQDMDGWVDDGLDIDAYENSMCICSVSLNLDDDVTLDLHYNSEDGTVLCANQLVEQLRSGDALIPCQHKDAVANVYLPGALDSDHPSTAMLEITINKPEKKYNFLTSMVTGRVATISIPENVSVLKLLPSAIQIGYTAGGASGSVSYDTNLTTLNSNDSNILIGGDTTFQIYASFIEQQLIIDINIAGSSSSTINQFIGPITTIAYINTHPGVAIEYDTYEYMV